MNLKNLDRYITDLHEEGYTCRVILELTAGGTLWSARVVDVSEDGYETLLDRRGEKFMAACTVSPVDAMNWLDHLAA